MLCPLSYGRWYGKSQCNMDLEPSRPVPGGASHHNCTTFRRFVLGTASGSPERTARAGTSRYDWKKAPGSLRQGGLGTRFNLILTASIIWVWALVHEWGHCHISIP